MKLRLLSALKTIYNGDAREVILPGLDGEFSVMDFHTPFLYSLGKGVLKVLEADRSSIDGSLSFLIRGGIAQMSANTLTVLTQNQ